MEESKHNYSYFQKLYVCYLLPHLLRLFSKVRFLWNPYEVPQVKAENRSDSNAMIFSKMGAKDNYRLYKMNFNTPIFYEKLCSKLLFSSCESVFFCFVMGIRNILWHIYKR